MSYLSEKVSELQFPSEEKKLNAPSTLCTFAVRLWDLPWRKHWISLTRLPIVSARKARQQHIRQFLTSSYSTSCLRFRVSIGKKNRPKGDLKVHSWAKGTKASKLKNWGSRENFGGTPWAGIRRYLQSSSSINCIIENRYHQNSYRQYGFCPLWWLRIRLGRFLFAWSFDSLIKQLWKTFIHFRL